MNFAFDVDGVITDAPEFFKHICRAIRKDGHKVHIVSGFDENFRKQRLRELETLGIEYDHFEITADKEGFCKSNEIDFVIDDHILDYFPKSSHVPVSILELKNAK